MRVIFLRDVPRVGKKYEIKNVADGFVKNMLLPKGLVEVATDKSVERVEALKKNHEEKRRVLDDMINKNVGELGSVVVKLKEKTNEKGHLFAGIHDKELSVALKNQTGISLDPEFIVLEKPIRETGEFIIPIKIHQKRGEFKLIVESI